MTDHNLLTDQRVGHYEPGLREGQRNCVKAPKIALPTLSWATKGLDAPCGAGLSSLSWKPC